MTIEERLAAAEQRIADLERRMGAEPIMPQPVVVPWQQPWALPVPVPSVPRCACPPNTICGNVACPHRMQVTCVTATACTPDWPSNTRLQQ